MCYVPEAIAEKTDYCLGENSGSYQLKICYSIASNKKSPVFGAFLKPKHNCL